MHTAAAEFWYEAQPTTTLALSIYPIALSTHPIALNVHPIALIIYPIALSIHPIACTRNSSARLPASNALEYIQV
eukprot:1185906-Prorocentrum_minimum.AAC.2